MSEAFSKSVTAGLRDAVRKSALTGMSEALQKVYGGGMSDAIRKSAVANMSDVLRTTATNISAFDYVTKGLAQSSGQTLAKSIAASLPLVVEPVKVDLGIKPLTLLSDQVTKILSPVPPTLSMSLATLAPRPRPLAVAAPERPLPVPVTAKTEAPAVIDQSAGAKPVNGRESIGLWIGVATFVVTGGGVVIALLQLLRG